MLQQNSFQTALILSQKEVEENFQFQHSKNGVHYIYIFIYGAVDLILGLVLIFP